MYGVRTAHAVNTIVETVQYYYCAVQYKAAAAAATTRTTATLHVITCHGTKYTVQTPQIANPESLSSSCAQSSFNPFDVTLPFALQIIVKPSVNLYTTTPAPVQIRSIACASFTCNFERRCHIYIYISTSYHPANMSACVRCQTPLVLTVDLSDDEEDSRMDVVGSSSAAAASTRTVPDDVALSCGCHFHWCAILTICTCLT